MGVFCWALYKCQSPSKGRERTNSTGNTKHIGKDDKCPLDSTGHDVGLSRARLDHALELAQAMGYL